MNNVDNIYEKHNKDMIVLYKKLDELSFIYMKDNIDEFKKKDLSNAPIILMSLIELYIESGVRAFPKDVIQVMSGSKKIGGFEYYLKEYLKKTLMKGYRDSKSSYDKAIKMLKKDKNEYKGK